MTSCNDQLTGRQGCVHDMVVNFSNEEIELPIGTKLGVAEETSASIVAAINEEELQILEAQGKNTVE